jgi:pSer/pThr/pTyr-binding forkhead associated (FHA) protein/Tfp pilus assembly protein PilZ
LSRALLNYAGQKILLPRGETLMGRSLDCSIRFNDPAVSREHARLSVREDGRLTIENLSRTNGTSVNGARVAGVSDLRHGDQIRVGHRRLVVELVADIRHHNRRSITLDDQVEAEPGSGLLLDEESTAAESTRPGELLEDPREALGALDAGHPELEWYSATPPGQISPIRRVNCPRCRAIADPGQERCDRCGHAFPLGRPSSPTLTMPKQAAPRTAPRYSVAVPVIYSSEFLTFEATVRDISRGGMFIATELLDPIGTRCDLTALPDGHPAVSFAGEVVHVGAGSADDARPAGLGVKLTDGSTEARRWLDSVLSRFPAGVLDP